MSLAFAKPNVGAEPHALGRLGGLVARLAVDECEVREAQRLRHAVFVEECGADGARRYGVESDALDAACDHLLVVDPRAGDAVVGTYRLLTEARARARGGFYSESEFEIDALLARHPQRHFLELGRSCVQRDYRDRRTIELLWQGVWAYAVAHGIDAMFGCVSLPGTRPEAHGAAFAYLLAHEQADAEWRVRALPERRVPMVDHAAAAPDETLSPRAALRALPPLLKGYLRLGGRVGPDCVIDRDFRCIDLMLTLPREAIAARYLHHYGTEAERFR